MVNAWKKYRNRITIVAVQLDLCTAGLTYEKWGGTQHAKKGDWLVNRGGEVYTIDAESFAATYIPVGVGQYKKTAPTWARQENVAGEVRTKEGVSKYVAGDWIACNDYKGNDMYFISQDTFSETFEPYPD